MQRAFWLILTLLLPLTLLAHEPPVSHEHMRIGGYLGAYLQARTLGNHLEMTRQLANGRARWQGDKLEIQVQLPDPEALTDADLRTFGGEVLVRGIDLADVALPVEKINPFMAHHPEIVFAQLPERGVPLLGPHQSQGATRFHSPQVQCLAEDGTPTVVAVLDEDFQDLDKSLAAGELKGFLPGDKLALNGQHGTMCVETVADVAPLATLVPWSASSLTAMQALAKEVTLKGNPKHIQVVSHSVGWFGQSFGRHTGPLCAVTDLVRSANIVWVNAAGNNSGGEFYQGVWTDADKDQHHEFQTGGQKLRFHVRAGTPLQLIIDWDDYVDRKVDLDVFLYRKDPEVKSGDPWVLENTSQLKQGKYGPPAEWLVVQEPKDGEYGVEIVANTPVPEGMRLRVVSTGYGVSAFSVWTDNGNVYDPASCKGVLAVGALRWGQYDQGPLEDYSSYGPTADGRQKPEVVGPTGTTTSIGDFYGTSCACPHVAGVAALYRSAHPDWDASAVVAAIIADAKPMGDGGFPDAAYGFGRVEVPAVRLGWECTQSASEPADTTCTTACGSIGTHGCTLTCTWNSCMPPSEICNGKDDNCDGVIDENCPVIAKDVSNDSLASSADSSSDTGPTSVSTASSSGCSSGAGSASGWIAGSFCVLALFARRRRGKA